jgi:hypothetical protein
LFAWLKKGKAPPSQDVLERQALYALMRLGRHYGRAAAYNATFQYARLLGQPDSDIAVAVDIAHMEEVL